jgi:hypothetical protein
VLQVPLRSRKSPIYIAKPSCLVSWSTVFSHLSTRTCLSWWF